MSAFSDLYRRFPAQMFDLCLQECFHEQRPLFWSGQGPDAKDVDTDWRHLCDWCDKPCIYRHTGYDAQRYDPPWPEGGFDRDCGEPRCAQITEFFCNWRDGRSMRRKFAREHGVLPMCYPQPRRIEMCIAFMLNATAKRKERDGREKLRRAA